MLFQYMQRTQGLIRDRSQRFLNPESLVSYVNQARREVAMRAQCIRRVPLTSGSILEIQVILPGTGYTNPTVVISSPDSPGGLLLNPGGLQATATAQFIGGQISNISVQNGGSGYFQPQVQITDPHGTGATARAIVTPINTVNANQENYQFSDINMSMFPGVGQVYSILNNAIIYSNYRYTLLQYPWTEYQANIRQYPFQYYYVPTFCCIRQQGAGGEIFMYPLPSQAYQWEPDCLCLPVDLDDDTTFEAIGAPWTDAVPFRAAALCYEELQSFNAAKFHQEQFDMYLSRYSSYARPRLLPNIYGRY